MPKKDAKGRRDFLKKSSLGASMFITQPFESDTGVTPVPEPALQPVPYTKPLPLAERELDLTPARWIWYPSARVLQNTVVLFRKRVFFSGKPASAKGWILGDSRYRLFVNGERVQWGPAPSDPRYAEADPLDLTEQLIDGTNTIGAEVLYYGQGDGTWPIGKAGFIFYLEITHQDGQIERIVSDASWKTHLARSWKPGQYKRWYLRAFQEEFDARLYPEGWLAAAYQPGTDWLDAMEMEGSANDPALSTSGRDYLFSSSGDPELTQLRKRSVPMLTDVLIEDVTLREVQRIRWHRPAEEYFESLTPNAFSAEPYVGARESGAGVWDVTLQGEDGISLTYEFKEQIVGWPYFTITAPAGTIIEVMVQEGHEVGGPAMLNTRFHSWTRFICKAGTNTFEAFDFESLRWLQLHIRNGRGTAVVEKVGVRRRVYPWTAIPQFSCSDESIEKVWNASVNTLRNCAQDTIVDCMGRERQQYSGDIGHTIHAIYYAFGETQQIARYVDTFGQGLTNAGYFLDCWPAYDRLARIAQRELQLTPWGPLLDHGIGHIFDAYYYYLYSGDLVALEEAYPRFVRFFEYLLSIRSEDSLLPVENLGTPTVWIDRDAYAMQRHKQCVFNMYAAAMLQHALAPLCTAHNQTDVAARVAQFGKELQDAVVGYFWSRNLNTFVVNQPWLFEERDPRFCDRSLATAIMFNMCPGDRITESVRLLEEMPDTVGLSYPANAGWRLWGLTEGGRGEVVVKELRDRWGKMRSVHENNTLSEGWDARYDTTDQWSHAPVAPLYLLYMGIMGLRPTRPGYTEFEVKPQLGDLTSLSATAQTAVGPVRMEASGSLGNRTLRVQAPARGDGYLVLSSQETVTLELRDRYAGRNVQHYVLPKGEWVELVLRFT